MLNHIALLCYLNFFTGNSLEEFQWLLNVTSTASNRLQVETTIEQGGPTKSTITVWGTDILNKEQQDNLLVFIDNIGRDRCYTDTTADTDSSTTTDSSFTSQHTTYTTPCNIGKRVFTIYKSPFLTYLQF